MKLKINEKFEFTETQFNELPLIATEELQSLISEKGLKKRAKVLYDIAKGSIGKYGHPTHVIGSLGHWGTIGYIKSEIYFLVLSLNSDLGSWQKEHQREMKYFEDVLRSKNDRF
ncbi:uncharacterized protein RJT21DRAFT_2132 [Scheffersomyces amazonensis]|uniref:uncharacterized protein n=1 Tax=Scheffersomyces amazonensis TaxID=1078765 RepID=UPI00315DC7EE